MIRQSVGELQSVIVHTAFVTALLSAWTAGSALCCNVLLYSHLLPDHEAFPKPAAHP